MMKTMKRLGLFGGPAKIHQMFEDYRQGQSPSPNTQPDDEDRPSLTSELIALGIGITVAALVWKYAPDHDEAN